MRIKIIQEFKNNVDKKGNDIKKNENIDCSPMEEENKIEIINSKEENKEDIKNKNIDKEPLDNKMNYNNKSLRKQDVNPSNKEKDSDINMKEYDNNNLIINTSKNYFINKNGSKEKKTYQKTLFDFFKPLKKNKDNCI